VRRVPDRVASAWRRRGQAQPRRRCRRALEKRRQFLGAELELPSVTKHGPDRGTGHQVVAIEKRQTQPLHNFIESQTTGEQPQT
jgi:hypothetical protein